MKKVTLDSQIVSGAIKLGRGNIISSKDIIKIPGEYPIYSSSAKGNGEFGRYGYYMFDEDLITWSIDGGGRFFYRPKHKFSITNVCGYMKIDKDVWDKRFVYYLLDFQHKRMKFDYQTKAHPSVIRHIYELWNIDMDEQNYIAKILSTMDFAITQTELLMAKRERIKIGLMQDIFIKGIDENGIIRAEETHKFIDSPIGRIPVEWELMQIGNVVTLQRGHDITENELIDGPYPVVSSSGVIGYHEEFTSKGPNVVVGRKGTIGKVHYIENDFWAHDTSLYVINFRGNNERFIFYLFNYLDLAKYGTKSGSPSLNRNDIHPLWIGRPSIDEQKRIINILMKCDQRLKSLELALDKLRSIKTALMQDLLTGNKRVTPITKENRGV